MICTCYLEFVCSLRLNLRHSRYSFEDMTHLPNMDRQSTSYVSMQLSFFYRNKVHFMKGHSHPALPFIKRTLK